MNIEARKQFGSKLKQILSEHYPGWRDDEALPVSAKTIENWMYDTKAIQRSTFFRLLNHLPCPDSEKQAIRTLLDQLEMNGSSPTYQAVPRETTSASKGFSRRSMLLILGALVVLGTILLVIARLNTAAAPILKNTDWPPQQVVINGLPMVKVPAGCFNMGSLTGRSDEQPVVQYCIDHPYSIGETEITNEQFGSPPDTTCNTNKVTLEGLVNGIDANFPHNCVTWEQANDFCAAKGMRLPTEAEWEFAARGPDNLMYPWGNSPIYGYAIVRTNFSTNAVGGTMYPVKSKPQDVSWVGAYDMAGSLREFTSTIYDTIVVNGKPDFAYPYNPNDGRENLSNTGTSTNVKTRDADTTIRVVRGGSFDFGIEKATTTIRNTEYWDFLWNDYGFRCASA